MYRYQKYMREDKGIFPISELASWSAREYGDRPVMRTWNGHGYDEITYNQLHQKVDAVAKWLVDQKIEKGDRVAVLGKNSPEWAISYLAIQSAGGVVVPVDSMMPASGIRHIISNSSSRILFSSLRFIHVMEELEDVAALEKTVCFEDNAPGDTIALETVLQEGKASNSNLPKRDLEELAALIYTSGTTGHSKGVMLSQRNIMSNVQICCQILPLGPKDTYLSVLPLHHTYESTTGFILALYCGCSITYARSMKSTELLADMRNTNVTIMIGVPLLYEKMYQGFLRKLKKKSAVARNLFGLLMGIDALGWKLKLRPGRFLFKKMRETAGMGTLTYMVSGGGPLDPAVASFFHRFGLNVMQGYGLTETSPLTHVNLAQLPSHATVGPPIKGVECKILDPNEHGIGEICIKGPNVFKGYYRNEEATAATFSEDGWFNTGDLGFIDPKTEFLKITGRKKNMLVTAGGKNVYPEEIEHFLNRSEFILESVVLGFSRGSGYGDEVAALIYPDYEHVDLHFEAKGTKPSAEDVNQLIKLEIREAQKNLQDYKRIRRFRIMEEEFQKTSTRKIKRYIYSGDMLNINGEKV